MASFAWKARDSAGRARSGVLEASGASTAASLLRERGFLVLDIESARGPVRSRASSRETPVWPRLRPVDIENGLRQLALLHRAGVPAMQAFETAAVNAPRSPMRAVFERCAIAISEGRSMAEALDAEEKTFPPLVRELVRTGEASGTLDGALTRAVRWLESRRLLRSTVRQALFYPAIVVVVTAAVCLFLLVSVVPVLEQFLQGSRGELPFPTRALLAASLFLRTNGYELCIGFCVVITTLLALDRFPPAGGAFDRILGAVPGIGRLRSLAATAVFARTLSVLLESGLSILQALPLIGALLQRPAPSAAVARAREGILRGEPLSESLVGERVFQPILARMVAVGEKSGELTNVLADVATFHEEEIAAWLRRASTLVEPVLTVVVGVVVGFVYIAFFLALFAASGGLR